MGLCYLTSSCHTRAGQRRPFCHRRPPLPLAAARRQAVEGPHPAAAADSDAAPLRRRSLLALLASTTAALVAQQASEPPAASAAGRARQPAGGSGGDWSSPGLAQPEDENQPKCASPRSLSGVPSRLGADGIPSTFNRPPPCLPAHPRSPSAGFTRPRAACACRCWPRAAQRGPRRGRAPQCCSTMCCAAPTATLSTRAWRA